MPLSNNFSPPDSDQAYSALNELFEQGKISGSQAAELRTIYGRMLAHLDHMTKVEKDLFSQAKNYTIEIEDQSKQLALDSDNEDSGTEEMMGPGSGSGPGTPGQTVEAGSAEAATPTNESFNEADKTQNTIASEDSKVSRVSTDPGSTLATGPTSTATKTQTASSSSKKSSLSEVQQLRNQVMTKLNSLSILEEQNSEDSYMIEVLTEHKRLLQLEKDRQPDEKMIARQEEDLRSEVSIDSRALSTLTKSVKSCKENIAELELQLITQKQLLEKAIENQEQVTAEMVTQTNIDGMHPAELTRQIGKTAKKKVTLEKEKELQQRELEKINSFLKEKLVQHDQYFDKADAAKKLFRESENKNESKEKECAMFIKNLEREKEREQAVLQEKEDLEVTGRALEQEKTGSHDMISKRKREFEKESRHLKKKQLQVGWVHEQSEQHGQQLQMIQVDVDNFPKSAVNEKEARDLLNEVETLKKKKMNEESHTKEAKMAWESLIETINKLSKEQEQERSICYEQGRMQHLKSDEREQKSREKQRAVNRLKQVEMELAAKQHELVDAQKRSRELALQQEQSAKVYEQIKNEKNKYVNSIQSASQKREEIKHKLRNSANEIEVLQQRLGTADRELTRRKKLNVSAETKISQEETKLNRANQVQEAINEELGQVRVTTLKLNNQKQVNDDEMEKLRKKYDRNVNLRNQRGIQLIEREEEVCVFYEKLNVQDNVIKKGDVKLQELEDEIKFLNNQVIEEKRQIDILRQYRPELKALKNELIDLQIELSRTQDRTVELEQKLESPEKCQSRIRHLEGEDLKPDQLESKLAQLELRLAQKEEQSLEKTLIDEQVERLLTKLQEQQVDAHDDKRILSEQLAESKARLDEMNRKTLAKISEIAMEKASNLSLQDQVKDLTTMAGLCNERFTQGKPPTDEMLEEWKKYIRNQQMKQEERLKEHQQYLELQRHILPNGGGITTAEPRPNAYLVNAINNPSAGESGVSNSGNSQGSSQFTNTQRSLPIPKPYGNMAPFKPQQPGATMRHIKKPKAKPLEI